MKILVVGNGRMGRAVASVATERQHDALGPIGRSSQDSSLWDQADVAVDFSVPEALAHHVEHALQSRTPLVVGTTGWAADLNRISTQVEEEGGTLVWGANFSIGFHMMMTVARAAADWARAFPEFDAAIVDHHHRMKRDAPSGSALELAAMLLDELPDKTQIQAGSPQGPIDRAALHVTSVRAGSEPGLHRVLFDGPYDQVSIEHRVRDRSVFAAGAVFAAERAEGYKGVIHFQELLVNMMKKGGTPWS